MKKFLVCGLVLVMLVAISGCASDTMARNTAGGTLTGAGVGAAIGAILGAIVGDPATGAAIGAVSGAAFGGSVGAASGYDLKQKRSMGYAVPPAPAQALVSRYSPYYRDNLWRCADDSGRELWWDEWNGEYWR